MALKKLPERNATLKNIWQFLCIRLETFVGQARGQRRKMKLGQRSRNAYPPGYVPNPG